MIHFFLSANPIRLDIIFSGPSQSNWQILDSWAHPIALATNSGGPALSYWKIIVWAQSIQLQNIRQLGPPYRIGYQ
jgi:hypothetical protein